MAKDDQILWIKKEIEQHVDFIASLAPDEEYMNRCVYARKMFIRNALTYLIHVVKEHEVSTPKSKETTSC